MKKKLIVFTLYTDKGASSNYRAYIFKEPLENEFDVKWFSFWNDNFSNKYLHNKRKYIFHIAIAFFFSILKRLWQLYFIAPKADVIFIQKGVIPKFSPTFLKHLKSKEIRIIFDVDDAIYLIRGDNSDQIAKISDVVICGNETLKKHYQHSNLNCKLIPTTDNTHLYKTFWSNTFDKKVIGWIGSKTTVDNLSKVEFAINKLAEKYPEVSFDIISNNALNFPEKIKNTKLIKWTSETYLRDLSDISIGIMPLEDNAINRGKCGFKLIQYLSMKKPVVGSNVGVNGQIIGKNGIVINNDSDWFNALETLLFNKEEYQKRINNIEEHFFNYYHFDVVSQQLIDIIKGI